MGKQRQEWKEWLLRTLGVVWSAFMGKFVVKWQVWQERLLWIWRLVWSPFMGRMVVWI